MTVTSPSRYALRTRHDMNGILAIAITTFRHCVRSRVVLLGIAAYIASMALCVTLAPRPQAPVDAAEADEVPGSSTFDAERTALTPDSERIRFIQSTSLGVAFFFGQRVKPSL